MTQVATQSKTEVSIPCGRAQILSAIRVTLHGAVLVALVLTNIGFDNFAAISLGAVVGLLFAVRSRRIGIDFATDGLIVRNYFRTYLVENLQGAMLRTYIRNRNEIQPAVGKPFVVQAASLLDEENYEAFVRALKSRGASVHTSAEPKE